VNTQNITLSIPKDTLLKVKVIAAQQGISISGLMTRTLEEIVSKEEGYQTARRRHLKMLENDTSLETNGNLSWTRDQLHER
jgi:hypothetical protein